MLELSEKHLRALEGMVDSGEARSLAEALDEAIAHYCAPNSDPIEADPGVLKLLTDRRAEMREGKFHAFDSISDMDAFLKQQISERAAAKAKA